MIDELVSYETIARRNSLLFYMRLYMLPLIKGRITQLVFIIKWLYTAFVSSFEVYLPFRILVCAVTQVWSVLSGFPCFLRTRRSTTWRDACPGAGYFGRPAARR